MRYVLPALVVLAVAPLGCSKPTSAADACAALVKAGVASGCQVGKPEGLGANAREKVVFDLPSVPGKTGQVLTFADDAAYDECVADFDKAKVLAGPHRYGNRARHVFVQFNDGASMDTGAKARAAIEAL